MSTVLQLQGLSDRAVAHPDTVSTNSFIFCGSSASLALCLKSTG